MPSGKGKRCCWLTMGASMGEKSHLPVFLFNVLGAEYEPTHPRGVIEALSGKVVKIQLKNKPNKDKTRPPYQNVIYDAVLAVDSPEPTKSPEPMNEQDQKDMPF